MDRILLLLEGESYESVRDCLESALTGADRPSRITAGLLLQREPGEEACQEMGRHAGVRYVVPGYGAMEDLELFWQGEAYVLSVSPDIRFMRHWDRLVIRALQRCGAQTVLTGIPPCAADPVEAVFPVACTGIEEHELILERGTALRYAASCHRCAFLNPGLIFAPAAFFRAMRGKSPLYLSAFVEGWNLYTLSEVLFHSEHGFQGLRTGWEMSRDMESFGEVFGLALRRRQVSATCRAGLYTPDLQVRTKIPLTVRVQERLRSVDNALSRVRPLCVTTCVELPGQELTELEMVRFRRLAGLKNMALLCYADGACIQRVLLSHPNCLEFHRRYGVNVQRRLEKKELADYIRLSRPAVLAASREKFPGHSHYLFVEFDIIHYPIYNGSALDWSVICTDRIVMGMVDRKPDLSMMCVPEERVIPLKREVDVLCEDAMSRDDELPDAEEIFMKIAHEHPDWFTFMELPGPRELLSLIMTRRGEEWGGRIR